MLFLLLLLLSAFGSTGLFTQIGYNGPWKWDTSSEPKRQLQLRRTAPLHFKMQRVTLCFTGNLSTSAGEEPGKEVGLHPDGAWQLLGHWWLLVQKHYEIAASLEKHKGKRIARSAAFPLLTDHVFYVADSMFVTTYLQMCASRTRLKLCIQTRGLLNHRPPTSATHLLHGWNTNRALILLFDFCILVFKCCLCNLCLASPQNFGGKEPLYLNSLKCNISLGLIFSSF